MRTAKSKPSTPQLTVVTSADMATTGLATPQTMPEPSHQGSTIVRNHVFSNIHISSSDRICHTTLTPPPQNPSCPLLRRNTSQPSNLSTFSSGQTWFPPQSNGSFTVVSWATSRPGSARALHALRRLGRRTRLRRWMVKLS
jgi:hypothetical protein